MVQNQVRQITVKLDTEGARKVRQISNELKALNRQVSSLSGFSRLLQNAFFVGFAGIGLTSVIRLADSMQLLTDRLSAVEGGIGAATAKLADLNRLAGRTNQTIDSVATVYVRLANATAGTGLSATGLLGTTETLINTFRLSGATITETTNTMIQLSQAFSSGELRGQELRSVMEQNAVVARLLRKEYGAEVYKKAEQGAIDLATFLRILLKEQESINEEAAKLGPTFEQTFLKALNSIKLFVNDVNIALELNRKFAKSVEFVTENIDLLAAAIGVLVAAKFAPLLMQIPAFSAALAGVVLATNPLILALGALAAATIYSYESIGEFRADLKLFQAELLELPGQLYKIVETMLLIIPVTTLFGLALREATGGNPFDDLTEKAKDYREEATSLYNLYREMARTDSLKPTDTMAEVTAFLQREDLEKIAGMANKAKDQIKVLTEQIALLNSQFASGSISANDFYSKLNRLENLKLKEEFRQGKIDLEKFNAELIKLQQLDLSRQFLLGKVSLEDFNRSMESLKIEEINNKLRAGRITWQEYRNEIDKVSTSLESGELLGRGANRYLNSIGSTADQIVSAIERAFGGLEDSFTEFIRTGTQDWRKFVDDILADVARILVRTQIVAPLASAAASYFGPMVPGVGGGSFVPSGSAGVAPAVPFSKVGYASGNDIYAKSSPSSSAPVTVNIVNNSSAEITQQESTGPNGERFLDVIIKSKVNEGFATGAFDKSLSQSYGLRRKGI